MAVIMAAMSGIIGGEVVLLGLIALPQMLRLGIIKTWPLVQSVQVVR
jgi:TRAP-type mannitol/chloroaromatic compound transport system permease large subunit